MFSLINGLEYLGNILNLQNGLREKMAKIKKDQGNMTYLT